MPFKSSSDMDQKQSFIRDYLTEEWTFSSLCQAYGISRRAGYDLVNRYEADPEHYHLRRSKRPLTSPWGTDSEMIERIKFWRNRKEKNKWGAKKIRAKLVEVHPELTIPSVTTIHNILVREGLVKRRKRRRQVVAQHPVFDPTVCNEIWSIDHKGKFYLGNRRRCSPLTVCDSFSRYLFTATGQYQETWRGVRQVLRRLFREYGKSPGTCILTTAALLLVSRARGALGRSRTGCWTTTSSQCSAIRAVRRRTVVTNGCTVT